MANEISLVTASGRTVTPKDDGIIYEVFSPGNGIIYGGAVTIKDSSTLHIAAGHGIVCGRKFTIDDSDIPVSLSGSGSLLGRLYIHLDLSDAADPIVLLVETGASLTPVVQDADVNINNGVYEINIATFDVDTSTISNLVDVAPYLNTNGYEHEQINNKIGDTDISGIGDGTATGAISALNADMTLDYTQSSLPENTSINDFLQMMLERFYPNHLWDAIANNYGQTYVGDPGIVSYVTDGETASYVQTSLLNGSAGIFFDTIVPTSGTLHIRGTVDAISSSNAVFKIVKNTAKTMSGDVTLISKQVVGSFSLDTPIEGGVYLCARAGYVSSTTVSCSVTITEFYID